MESETKMSRAIELLTEIRDRLRNLDTLEGRRRRDRERKRLVRGHKSCPQTKEDEKGKETFPPAPPIEKRAKEEEKDTLRVRACEDDREELFTQFWKAYPGPRKCRKQKCRDKFFAFLADPKTRQANFAKLMAGLERWKHHDSWMRDGGRFIQGPLVWLNNEDWDAEIAVGPLVSHSVRLDPKAAAFERQQAESEARRKSAAEIASRLLTESGVLSKGGAR